MYIYNKISPIYIYLKESLEKEINKKSCIKEKGHQERSGRRVLIGADPKRSARPATRAKLLFFFDFAVRRIKRVGRAVSLLDREEIVFENLTGDRKSRGHKLRDSLYRERELYLVHTRV